MISTGWCGDFGKTEKAMRRNALVKRWTALAVLLVVIAVTVSCGTILYPERRGQKMGRIDAGVAVLDGIGLLFFIVPGVVAFAVDFATGAIFLPGSRAGLDIRPWDPEASRVIVKVRRPVTRHQLETLLSRRTGQAVVLSAPGVTAARMSGEDAFVWGAVADIMTPEQFSCFDDGPMVVMR
ncbi:hypothetical protein [Desulfococcus sp.]|jgi:hypothetical protein|uniref:hypothetical protein n=1 Tax=Desulfococcus sp. TaxID=2025834 RepID=UPI003D13F70A